MTSIADVVADLEKGLGSCPVWTHMKPDAEQVNAWKNWSAQRRAIDDLKGRYRARTARAATEKKALA